MLACYGLALWVVIAKRNLCLELARSASYKFQAINTPRTLYILVSIVFTVCVGVKFFHLAVSGSTIPNELIAPVDLTPLGREVLTELNQTNKSSIGGLNCIANKDCSSDLERANSRIYEDNKFLLNYFSGSKNVSNWAINNSILVSDSTTWRGRYIHHYATVLFPLREINNGSYSHLLTSQYGLVSLLPLLFVKNISFVYYGLTSLIVLLIFGLYVLFKNRKAPINTLLYGAILFLIILSSDISALRLSPGFAYFRYLPIAILLLQLSSQLKFDFRQNYIFWITLALLNSIQFNILFILITLVWYAFVSLKRSSLLPISALRMPFCVMVIILIQLVLLHNQQNSFSPSIFSSVGEVPFSLEYALKILAFPLVLSVWVLTSGNLAKISKEFNDDQIILAYIIYGVCAIYAISFPGSPQHYVGSMLMAFFGIFILLRNTALSRNALIFSIASLFFVSAYYNYLSFGQKLREVKSNFYEYKNQIGSSIYFSTAVDVNKISSDYASLIYKFQNEGKIYLFSKDKSFIEIAQDRNIEPKIYDIYTNFLDITPDMALAKLKDDRVSYLVLDSPNKIDYSFAMNQLRGHDFGDGEYRNHKKILLNIQSLSKHLRVKLLECNQSFCIYKL